MAVEQNSGAVLTAEVAVAATSRALDVLREALENQKLCDPSIDVEETLAYAVTHPDKPIVDSFASVEILSSLDQTVGTALPKQVLNHQALTTLSGLTKSLGLIEARRALDPPKSASPKKGDK